MLRQKLKMTDNDLALQEEISHLGQQLFGSDTKKCASFTNRLWDIYTRAKGKDFLLIHNPGGWGSTYLEDCLEWERSIVEGVSAAIEQLGYSPLLVQYFRSGHSKWEHVLGVIKETRFLPARRAQSRESSRCAGWVSLRWIIKRMRRLP